VQHHWQYHFMLYGLIKPKTLTNLGVVHTQSSKKMGWAIYHLLLKENITPVSINAWPPNKQLAALNNQGCHKIWPVLEVVQLLDKWFFFSQDKNIEGIIKRMKMMLDSLISQWELVLLIAGKQYSAKIVFDHWNAKAFQHVAWMKL
jgi:hypothetical protein